MTPEVLWITRNSSWEPTDFPPRLKRRVPHFSRCLREVGATNVYTIVLRPQSRQRDHSGPGGSRRGQCPVHPAFAPSFTAPATLRPISAVEIAACALPANSAPVRSAVRTPEVSTRATAFSTPAASTSNPNECRNIMATDKIAPSGFAIPFPAISGADPCTGSYNPTAPPTLADARRPSEPTTPPA